MTQDVLWQVAGDFRRLVCQSLILSSPEQRQGCLGTYLFVIDAVPRFTVVVQATAISSTVLNDSSEPSPSFVAKCIPILTPSSRLLNGTLRAKIAFLTGRVKIQGDLLAFFKLTTLIKRQGVSARSLQQSAKRETPFERAKSQAHKMYMLSPTSSLKITVGCMVCHIWDYDTIVQINATYTFTVCETDTEAKDSRKDFHLKEVFLQGSSQEFLTWQVSEAIQCLPAFIPKPWGQEIWYTGIEKRGVSYIKTKHSSPQGVPLPWLWQALEGWSTQSLQQGAFAEAPPLVKVLDPLPLAGFGNLYSEIHLEKNEIYVVTHVEGQEGFIQFGANPEALAACENNEMKYKENFLKSIQKYEVIRRKIDDIFEDFRFQEGFSSHEAVAWGAALAMASAFAC